MSNESLVAIIVALIALIGTLAGIAVNYRQWRQDRNAERSKKYGAERRETYKTLWDQVEALNASLRRNKIDETQFTELVADLNEFMLRKSAYLDDNDQSLTNKYIIKAKQFHDIVSKSE